MTRTRRDRSNNDQDSWYCEAYLAGGKWLRSRVRTARRTFSVESGLQRYLTSLGLGSTLDLSMVGASSALLERYGNAKQAKAGFLDGVDAAWDAHHDRRTTEVAKISFAGS